MVTHLKFQQSSLTEITHSWDRLRIQGVWTAVRGSIVEPALHRSSDYEVPATVEPVTFRLGNRLFRQSLRACGKSVRMRTDRVPHLDHRARRASVRPAGR